MLVVLILALSGCLGANEQPPGSNETAPGEPLEDQKGPPGSNNSSAPPPDRPPPPEEEEDEGEGEDEREDDVPRDFGPWPPLSEARIRPGVQVAAGGAQCTSNFVFRSPDNATLFLGTAAHCVADGSSTNTNGCDPANVPLEPGSPVRISGATQPGTLVYSSWFTMQALEETSDAACRANDFALLAIHPDDRGAVHPAMLHFGGPTDLANGASTGEKVLSYGSSDLRFGLEPSNWHEGYVVGGDTWTVTAYMVSPVIPGDSGSAVLDSEGRAVGVAVTLGIAPLAGANGITRLDTALAYAEEETGLAVELVGWALLDPGLLP